MNKLFLATAIPLLGLSFVGCASKKKQEAVPAAPTIAIATPTPVPARSKGDSFQLRPYKEETLENGLKIIYVSDDSLPRVSLTLLFKTGNMQEPTELAGLNSFTANLLEQGTQTRNATKIADEFGQMGSSLDITPGSDSTMIYGDALTMSSDKVLELIADVAMNPAFKNGEIQRLRAQYLAALKKKVDNPSAFADEKLAEYLYGSHPYGRDVNGTPESIKAIRKQDIIKHYLTFYRPNNATLAVVGQFDEKYEQKVKETFGKWTKRTIPMVTNPPPPAIDKLSVKLYVKRGLKQTQIRLGQIGIERKDPDFIPLRMVNEALGGSFGSRLTQIVRTEMGLTYSISSYFDVRRDKGSFEISTFTKNETSEKALDETLKVVAAFAKSGASEAETSAARSQLVGQFPRAIETSDRLAYNLLVLDFYGISFDYLTNYIRTVNSIKMKTLNESFARHVDGSKFKVIVYGSDSIIPQFQKYKPEIVRVP